MPFTEAARNIFLDKLFRYTGDGYISRVSLHTADPGTTGANEVVGTGYARQSISMSTSGSSTTLASWENTGSTSSWGTITHIGLWYSTSTYLGSAALSVPKAALPGSIVSIPIGDLDITATGLTSTGRSKLVEVAGSAAKATASRIRLHTGDPGDDGTANLLSSALAPGYAHASVTWNPASGGTITNSNKPLWANNSGSAWPTVTHWSAGDSYSCYAKGALTSPIALATGDMMEFPVGSIPISLT
jgi:hypothetical protein